MLGLQSLLRPHPLSLSLTLSLRSSLPPAPVHRHFSLSSPAHAKKKRNMPPKKVVQEKKTLLGRPGNNLKIGIVGLFPTLSAPSPSLIHAAIQVCPTSESRLSSTPSPRPASPLSTHSLIFSSHLLSYQILARPPTIPMLP